MSFRRVGNRGCGIPGDTHTLGHTHSCNEIPLFPGQDLSHSCSEPPQHWECRAVERQRNTEMAHASAPSPHQVSPCWYLTPPSFPGSITYDYAGSRLVLTPVHLDFSTFLSRPTQPISAQPTSVVLNSTCPPNSTSFHLSHPNPAQTNATKLCSTQPQATHLG